MQDASSHQPAGFPCAEHPLHEVGPNVCSWFEAATHLSHHKCDTNCCHYQEVLLDEVCESLFTSLREGGREGGREGEREGERERGEHRDFILCTCTYTIPPPPPPKNPTNEKTRPHISKGFRARWVCRCVEAPRTAGVWVCHDIRVDLPVGRTVHSTTLQLREGGRMRGRTADYMYTVHVHVVYMYELYTCTCICTVHDQSRTCICKLKQGKASKAKSEGRQ